MRSFLLLFSNLDLKFANSSFVSTLKTKFFINLPTPAWMLNAPTHINISGLVAGTDEARFSKYEMSDSLKIFQLYYIRVNERKQ